MIIDMNDEADRRLDESCSAFATHVIDTAIFSLGSVDPQDDVVIDALAHAWKWLFIAKLKSRPST